MVDVKTNKFKLDSVTLSMSRPINPPCPNCGADEENSMVLCLKNYCYKCSNEIFLIMSEARLSIPEIKKRMKPRRNFITKLTEKFRNIFNKKTA